MRAEIRRIDLTTEPVTFEAGRLLDLVAAPAAPRGRSGLWDAMAHAVQRAREASFEQAGEDAEVLAPPLDSPHLAYLARVAADRNER
jgi:hypothetical protein